MPRKSPESTQLVKHCLELLQYRGVLAWRNNSTGIWDQARKIFRKFTGLKGTGDILAVLPGGRFLSVECKAGSGRPSKDQKHFAQLVERQGGVALTVHSLKELEQDLADLGVTA